MAADRPAHLGVGDGVGSEDGVAVDGVTVDGTAVDGVAVVGEGVGMELGEGVGGEVGTGVGLHNMPFERSRDHYSESATHPFLRLDVTPQFVLKRHTTG